MYKMQFLKRFSKLIFFLLAFFILMASMHAQRLVSGVVTGDGELLIGANVLLKGTSEGTSTDVDGKFSLKVPEGYDVLIVSYLGYVTKEVQITSNSLAISLDVEKTTLEEVVVVGYGTQKKSVVTGAISSIKAQDIENLPNIGRVEHVLQGRTSGVYIAANAGQPGSSSTIRVRGITSFNGYGGNNPLWVVDGVVINDDIGFLNQSDIESIEVLKDAASLAIYGARSASGVILVTTKKGKEGKINVGYSGTYGVSAPANTLKLLNATQYAALMNEKSINAGGDVLYNDLSALGTGTDWQKAIFSDRAPKSTHEINISGGNNVSNFYLSFGTQDIEGIVMPEISNYSKRNFRLNSTHKLSKIFTVGQSLGYSHQKSVGIGNTNSEYGGPLSSAINLDPITPLVETDPVRANNTSYYPEAAFRDENGQPYGISVGIPTTVGQEMSNPLAYAKTRLGQYGVGDDFVGNAFLEANILKNLKVKSSVGGKMAFWGGEGFYPEFYLNATYSNLKNNMSRSSNKLFAWNVENTITYGNNFNGHDVNILLGQGAYQDDNPVGSTVVHSGLPTNDYQKASFNYDIPASDKTGYAYTSEPHRVSSLFARVNYNFNEKYLFTGIIRRDGSTNFGANNKYGIFPSFSLGWVVSEEKFWIENAVINFLKFRGGYGATGNDRFRKFSYLSTIGGGRNYTFGPEGLIIYSGSSPDAPSNPDLKWEETRQTNVGFEARLFEDMRFTFDWYQKTTIGILQEVVLPGYVGSAGNPFANVADMKNTGIELELSYRKRFNQLNFNASGNFSTLNNEVTFLGNGIDFITTQTAGFQSMGPVTRTQVGQPYNSFYGYQTDGIFQNYDEVNAYKNAEGTLIQPNAKPGDFKWVDSNEDGTITDEDKVFLGNPIPKYTFGLTLNADYKGFDVLVFAQGMAGNKIFQGLRRLDILNSNYQTDALSRWHGEGTSDDYPRLTNLDENGNFGKMSDFYLQNGDFLRLKLIQLGYTLPKGVSGKLGIDKIRLYLSAENVFTWTEYTGYDPEIGGDVSGIDKGYYPQAKSYNVGINVQF
jgi:TonB-linked SusC/RagA family outer membrane protein